MTEEAAAQIQQLESRIRSITNAYNSKIEKLKTKKQKCANLIAKCNSAKSHLSTASSSLSSAEGLIIEGYRGFRLFGYKSQINSDKGNINSAISTLSKSISEATTLQKKIEKEMTDAKTKYQSEVRQLRNYINQLRYE